MHPFHRPGQGLGYGVCVCGGGDLPGATPLTCLLKQHELLGLCDESLCCPVTPESQWMDMRWQTLE